MNIFDSAKEKLAEPTETHGGQVESIRQFAEHVDTAQSAADGAIGT